MLWEMSVMCCYDVLNHYITDCSLNTLATGELTVAKKGVQSLDSEAITIFARLNERKIN